MDSFTDIVHEMTDVPAGPKEYHEEGSVYSSTPEPLCARRTRCGADRRVARTDITRRQSEKGTDRRRAAHAVQETARHEGSQIDTTGR